MNKIKNLIELKYLKFDLSTAKISRESIMSEGAALSHLIKINNL